MICEGWCVQHLLENSEETGYMPTLQSFAQNPAEGTRGEGMTHEFFPQPTPDSRRHLRTALAGYTQGTGAGLQ